MSGCKCSGAVMPCGNGCAKVAYGFVMVQDVDRFYDYESAFVSGTIFPDLAIPQGQYGPNEIFDQGVRK